MDSGSTLQWKALLVDAVKRGAADIHLSVGSVPMARINGQLVPLEGIDAVSPEALGVFIDTYVAADIRKRLTEERDIVSTIDVDKNLRFKISAYYQKDLLSLTLRYIPVQVPTLAALGLQPVMRELSALQHGLVIISGPFGSGRSTTAAALIEEVNQHRRAYIITVEDPIEYVFANSQSVVEQRQVGRDTKSFTDALRYFEEEDGDILFLEEMDDPATTPLVLEIARGSALVLTTLSADSAAQTIARILDSFTSLDQDRIRDMLAHGLQAVVCQKLLPRVGGGMLVVQEVMKNTEAVRASIRNGNIDQLATIMQTSRREGMVSFEQALAELVRNHQVTLDDALVQANDPRALESLLRD